jgi:hypothetical protein
LSSIETLASVNEIRVGVLNFSVVLMMNADVMLRILSVCNCRHRSEFHQRFSFYFEVSDTAKSDLLQVQE